MDIEKAREIVKRYDEQIRNPKPLNVEPSEFIPHFEQRYSAGFISGWEAAGKSGEGILESWKSPCRRFEKPCGACLDCEVTKRLNNIALNFRCRFGG